MARTPFDQFTRDLADDPQFRPDAAVLRSWQEREVREWGGCAALTFSDITNEELADKAMALLVSDAPTAPAEFFAVWRTALEDCMIAAARRRIGADEYWAGILRPLKDAIDHFDAIDADRRALARTRLRKETQ